MGAQQCCNDWETQEGKRKEKNLLWCHGGNLDGSWCWPWQSWEILQTLKCFIVSFYLAVKAQWVFMAWTSSEVYLCIDKAPCDKQCCLSISWNKPYPRYITLRATWIEKYLHVLFCHELLPNQTLSLVKAGENHWGSWIEMDGEMGLTGYLKVICVSGFYQLCFLKLDAATLESKDRVFLLFRHSVLYPHIWIITTAFPVWDILWFCSKFSKNLIHISLCFGEEAKRLLKWHNLVNLDHRWNLTPNLVR